MVCALFRNVHNDHSFIHSFLPSPPTTTPHTKRSIELPPAAADATKEGPSSPWRWRQRGSKCSGQPVLPSVGSEAESYGGSEAESTRPTSLLRQWDRGSTRTAEFRRTTVPDSGRAARHGQDGVTPLLCFLDVDAVRPERKGVPVRQQRTGPSERGFQGFTQRFYHLLGVLNENEQNDPPSFIAVTGRSHPKGDCRCHPPHEPFLTRSK